MRPHLRKQAARETLFVLVHVKAEVRDLAPFVPYHRSDEHLAVMGIVDRAINAVIDNEDVADDTAAAWLDVVRLFAESLKWPEPATGWEGS